MLPLTKSIAAIALTAATFSGSSVSADSLSVLSPKTFKTALVQESNLKFSTFKSKLNNPSSVSIFSIPNILDIITICDSGNGIVIAAPIPTPNQTKNVTNFDTEHWKVDKATGTKRFKLGPLSAIWLGGRTLAVTDGGKKDGEETILFFTDPGDASTGKASNAVAGEGNLTGMAATEDGKTIYLCGQGSDEKSWVLACDVATKKLTTKFSADDHGITINSPMQVVVQDDNHILVLYSGKGGVKDGLIVQWDLKTGKPSAKWNLPGLVDPMGMAFLPGSKDTLAVVDNNWALTKVNKGQLATVKLTPKAEDAAVTILDNTTLQGPVSCAFDSKGTLYVAQLGPQFDQNQGSVVAITGIK